MRGLLAGHWKLATILAFSLAAAGALTVSAQPQRGRPGLDTITESPTIVFGNDVGFRIERTQDGIPIGRVVVRVDGRWVETAALTSR